MRYDNVDNEIIDIPYRIKSTKILPKTKALVLCITKWMKNKVENFNTLKGQRWKKLAFLLSYEIYEV